MPGTDNRGGHRNGAGRHPGPLSLHPALPAPLENDNDAAGEPLGLSSLPPAVQSCIRFAALGLPNADIARRLEKNPGTIREWIHKYPGAVDEAVRALTTPADSLRQHLPAATRVYGELLGSGDKDSTRLQAADSVYDRLFGKPAVKIEQHTQQDVRIVFIDATND